MSRGTVGEGPPLLTSKGGTGVEQVVSMHRLDMESGSTQTWKAARPTTLPKNESPVGPISIPLARHKTSGGRRVSPNPMVSSTVRRPSFRALLDSTALPGLDCGSWDVALRTSAAHQAASRLSRFPQRSL